MATVAPGKGECLEEARGAMIDDGAAVAAGLVPEGSGDPTFPEAVCPVISRFSCRSIQPPSIRCAMTRRSMPRGVRRSRSSTLAAWRPGGLAQGRELQAGGQAPGISLGGLTIHEQAEPILEAERLESRASAALLVKRRGHSGQAEHGVALGSRVGQHLSSPCQW